MTQGLTRPVGTATGASGLSVTTQAISNTATPQAVPANTITRVNLSSVVANSTGFTFANNRLTAQTAGWYQVTGFVRFASGNGARVTFVYKNGADIGLYGTEDASSGFSDPAVQCSNVVYLAVGDYIEVWVFSQVALNLNFAMLSAALMTTAQSSTLVPGPWTSLTPTSGSAGGLAYRLVGDRVELRGFVTGLNLSSGVMNSVFTLPVGFRPPITLAFPVLVSTNNSMANLNINNDGTAVLYVPSTLSSVAVSFSVVAFSITS